MIVKSRVLFLIVALLLLSYVGVRAQFLWQVTHPVAEDTILYVCSGVLSNQDSGTVIYYKTDTATTSIGSIKLSHVESYERIVNATYIFPNPASTVLHVISNDLLHPIHILDMLGREVFQALIPETGKLTLDVSSFAFGVYYIQLNHFGKMLPIGKFAITNH